MKQSIHGLKIQTMKNLTLGIKKKEDTKALVTCRSKCQGVSSQHREGYLQFFSRVASITERFFSILLYILIHFKVTMSLLVLFYFALSYLQSFRPITSINNMFNLSKRCILQFSLRKGRPHSEMDENSAAIFQVTSAIH